MNPLQILLILRAHYKIALAVALATIAIALAVTLLLPKRYTAATSVLVDVKSPDPIVAMMLPSSLATQVDIINSQRVALRVVRTLGLVDAPGVRDQWASATDGRGTPETWLADLLLRGLAVAPSRDSNIVNIAYTGTDPAFVAAVANGFAQAYMDVTIELKVDPARQYARWFGDQGKLLRENLEKAQTKLSQFQQQKGIVAREEQMDIETSRLTDLSSQLVRAQAETNDARIKQQSGRAGDRLPEVSADSVVSGLRNEIVRMEAKLQDLNLGKNHPQYLRMQTEVAELKKQLANEMARVTNSFSATSTVGGSRESVLRAAIEAQKKKLLENQRHARRVGGAPARRRRRKKCVRCGHQAIHRIRSRQSGHPGQRFGTDPGACAARTVVSETAGQNYVDGDRGWNSARCRCGVPARDARPAYPHDRRSR